MPKRLLSGTVVSANSNKTIVVKVTRRVKHKLYRKKHLAIRIAVILFVIDKK